MAYSYWYGLVIDPDFDTMFNGPMFPVFQEEAYQGKHYNASQVYIRPAVVNNPAIGKHSVWPEQKRRSWNS